ncbi:hypothetical protein CCZ01_02345 [Helicobacter monodelphidis]|uniref:cache domain-containing protein n=1 Tax=Helicobacter sp. 15-1451 TaxID=2004995 RepID=UPI000DCB6D98|nr:cache domain-containing protein [Helicobacter sp. 15-1451]RAX58643.1 hypothetical protein CCZ01_02345 [Helicobacter sp. 15-1451]
MLDKQLVNLLTDNMNEISTYRGRFYSLNSLLRKTTLTGKISSLDIAENLFQYMEETGIKFSQLQDRLISTLMDQHFKILSSGLGLTASVIARSMGRVIDNITATSIIFLESSTFNDLLSGIYTNEHSVYLKKFLEIFDYFLEINIVSKEGDIIFSTQNPQPKNTKTSVVARVLNEKSKIFNTLVAPDFSACKDALHLYIAYDKNGQKGVVHFAIKLECYSDSIFKSFYHASNASVIMAFLNERDEVIASSHQRVLPSFQKVVTQNIDEHWLFYIHKTPYIAEISPLPYLNYDLKWKSLVAISLKGAFDSRQRESIDATYLQDTALITDELKEVMEEADNLNEDLSDVVINGEIIASKRRSYALNPILNNIRILSEEIGGVCLRSIEDLKMSVFSSLLVRVDFYAKAVVSSLDGFLRKTMRVLCWYANDTQYLELKNLYADHTLKEYIAANESYITLFSFDYNGITQEFCRGDFSHQVGESIPFEHLLNVRSLKGDKSAYLSNFDFSSLYKEKQTYTLYAPTYKRHEERKELIGGLGILLNVESLLHDILSQALQTHREMFSSQSELFGIVIEKGGKIIASSNEHFKAGEILEIDNRYILNHAGECLNEIAYFQDKPYMISAQAAHFGEIFKRDNLSGTVVALIFLAL